MFQPSQFGGGSNCWPDNWGELIVRNFGNDVSPLATQRGHRKSSISRSWTSQNPFFPWLSRTMWVWYLKNPFVKNFKISKPLIFPHFPCENPDFFRLQRVPDTSKSAPKDRTVRMLRSASVDTALASAMDTRMDMLTCLGRQMKMGMEMRMKTGAFNVIYHNLSL